MTAPPPPPAAPAGLPRAAAQGQQSDFIDVGAPWNTRDGDATCILRKTKNHETSRYGARKGLQDLNRQNMVDCEQHGGLRGFWMRSYNDDYFWCEWAGGRPGACAGAMPPGACLGYARLPATAGSSLPTGPGIRSPAPTRANPAPACLHTDEFICCKPRSSESVWATTEASKLRKQYFESSEPTPGMLSFSALRACLRRHWAAHLRAPCTRLRPPLSARTGYPASSLHPIPLCALPCCRGFLLRERPVVRARARGAGTAACALRGRPAILTRHKRWPHRRYHHNYVLVGWKDNKADAAAGGFRSHIA